MTTRAKTAKTAKTADKTLEGRITETLLALASIPSVSGQEGEVRVWVAARLAEMGLAAQLDAAGNLLARVPAEPAARDAEPPLLLNAHLDRVPPGRAHTPILRDGILRGDGSTNLGADDSAGIAVILHAVAELAARGLPHPPLLLLFTLSEEVGLVGAHAFDPEPWGVREGLIFDNAGAAGEVVTRAATIIALDVTFHGRGGHPGKRLEGTASAIEMFHHARYPSGALDGDTTRVSIGRIRGGTARNAVPDELRVQGEVRTLLDGAEQAALLAKIGRAFTTSAKKLGGGSADVTVEPHCLGYTVAEDEPLLRAYGEALRARGQSLQTITTFIGSDASALRPRTRVLTVSTGAMDEHTVNEWIALAPLADLTETTVHLLSRYKDADF